MAKKLNISKNSVRQTVKEWTIITLGVILYSFAWVSIILPADGMGGGATGRSEERRVGKECRG